MKKLSFLLLIFFISVSYLNAECTYKDIKELNTLASYISVNYEYIEGSNTFNLTYYNLTDKMAIDYNGIHEASNGSIVLTNLSAGTSVNAVVIVKQSDDCGGEELRSIVTNIPYINEFYGRSECSAHMDLNVCSSKFLDYKLTEITFKSLLNKTYEEKKQEEDEETTVIEEEKNYLEKGLEVVKEYYIPVLLVIVSTILTYIVFSRIFRKIKHGL